MNKIIATILVSSICATTSAYAEHVSPTNCPSPNAIKTAQFII